MKETKERKAPFARRFSEEFKRDAGRLVLEKGYTHRSAAEAVGVSEKSLRDWHARLASKPEPCGEDASVTDLKAKNALLRRQLRQAEMEREILKKSDGLLREKVAVKQAWIQEHRDSFPVVLMCRVLGVSKSGYYASVDRPRSPRAQRTEKIEALVARVFGETDAIYGSVKFAEEMAERPELETACRNTVAAAMQRLGLRSKVKKGFRPTTTKADPSKRPAPNTLDRCFEAEGPNRKWVTDITYLKTAAG